MRNSISNISWEEAFQRVADHENRHELTMKITNELFPKENGELWEDWIGLEKSKRDQVYTELVKLDNK